MGKSAIIKYKCMSIAIFDYGNIRLRLCNVSPGSPETKKNPTRNGSKILGQSLKMHESINQQNNTK